MRSSTEFIHPLFLPFILHYIILLYYQNDIPLILEPIYNSKAFVRENLLWFWSGSFRFSSGCDPFFHCIQEHRYKFIFGLSCATVNEHFIWIVKYNILLQSFITWICKFVLMYNCCSGQWYLVLLWLEPLSLRLLTIQVFCDFQVTTSGF